MLGACNMANKYHLVIDTDATRYGWLVEGTDSGLLCKLQVEKGTESFTV